MITESEILQELTTALDAGVERDAKLLALLGDHHETLRECIDILRDENSTIEEKRATLSMFLHVANVHSTAEEETLYRGLRRSRNPTARRAALAGHVEHDLAYRLTNELHDLDFETEWTEEIDAKAEVLAKLVGNHLDAEESEVFPVAENALAPAEQEDLAGDYLEKCKFFLEIELRSGRSPAVTPSPLKH